MKTIGLGEHRLNNKSHNPDSYHAKAKNKSEILNTEVRTVRDGRTTKKRSTNDV